MQKKRSPDGASSAEKSASSTAPTSTEGGAKRRKFLSPSEVRTALQEAAEEIDLLKAELTKARTQNNQWLQLQQTIGAQKKQIAVLEDEKKELTARKIPVGHDLRSTAPWKWDNTKPGEKGSPSSISSISFLPMLPLFPRYLLCILDRIPFWIAAADRGAREGGGEGGGEGKREGGAAAYARLESKFRTLSCPVPRSGAPFSGH
jgi:hypothetical protein